MRRAFRCPDTSRSSGAARTTRCSQPSRGCDPAPPPTARFRRVTGRALRGEPHSRGLASSRVSTRCSAAALRAPRCRSPGAASCRTRDRRLWRAGVRSRHRAGCRPRRRRARHRRGRRRRRAAAAPGPRYPPLLARFHATPGHPAANYPRAPSHRAHRRYAAQDPAYGSS